MATQIAPKVEILRREIQEKYTEVADSPELTFHFHHGLRRPRYWSIPKDY